MNFLFAPFQVVVFVSAVFCSLSFRTHSQSDQFEWGEGLTYYYGKIDTTKYTYSEIELIYNYLHTPSSEAMTVGSIWKIEQMESANTDRIDSYYERTMRILETMRIPEGDYWDSLLVWRKKELFEISRNKRLFVLALHDPSLLYSNFKEECRASIEALNGDSIQLLAAWQELNERQKKMNCCPENIEEKYQRKLHSSEKLNFARLDLMVYDWGNCMNQFVFYYTDYDRVQREFEKLFVEVIREEYED